MAKAKAKKKTAAKKQAKKAPKKAVKKPAKKAAKKATPKAVKKVAQKVAKKPANNVPPEVAMALTHPLSTPKPHLNIVSESPVADSLDSSEKIKIGMKAPEFSLLSDEGKTVNLSSFKGKKVVIYFYPKDDTPGCTKESCDFRDSMSKLNSLQAVVLGVSKDDVESHKKFKAKFKLTFPLLADTAGKTCEAYGVWKEKSMYGKKFMGIERMTFLIGADGMVKKTYPKVKVEGHVDQVIQDLAKI